ncbi:hypothetical protein [[Mycoplasma] testudinis]|uniref:hypothetical protein n=1 Tax=[Mycoplasma] testudinis TaxID=33924 RepID=UPI000486DB8A|nr:hypothetical protein [[Mycoplasma] testudinis]
MNPQNSFEPNTNKTFKSFFKNNFQSNNFQKWLKTFYGIDSIVTLLLAILLLIVHSVLYSRAIFSFELFSANLVLTYLNLVYFLFSMVVILGIGYVPQSKLNLKKLKTKFKELISKENIVYFGIAFVFWMFFFGSFISYQIMDKNFLGFKMQLFLGSSLNHFFSNSTHIAFSISNYFAFIFPVYIISSNVVFFLIIVVFKRNNQLD